MKKEEMKTRDNSFGIAGVILGIIGIVFSSLSGVIFGIIGLVFSLKQKKLMKNSWSKAGIILNTIAMIIGIIVFVYAMISFFKNPEMISQLLNSQYG